MFEEFGSNSFTAPVKGPLACVTSELMQILKIIQSLKVDFIMKWKELLIFQFAKRCVAIRKEVGQGTVDTKRWPLL